MRRLLINKLAFFITPKSRISSSSNYNMRIIERFVLQLLFLVQCALVVPLFSVLIGNVDGHVTLTFPPARKLDLDFLNNFWTKPPCGMPKGSTRTTLVAGSSFNVNWQLGYSHKGGYKLELLDNREQKLMDLTIADSPDGFVYGNATTQWQKVYLPENYVCRDCTIRLLRQVKSFDPNFNFWSCADVDIVNPSQYVESCYHRGQLIGDKCKCNDGYWGKICQFKDECGTDTQCGGPRRGKCLYMGGTNLPRRQCFCQPGFHGESCAYRNTEDLPLPTHSLNLTAHVLQVFSERMLMYYRILPGGTRLRKDSEIEFIVLVNGTSYAGVGWRPINLGPICKSWPFIKDALDETSNLINTGNKNRRQSDNGAAAKPPQILGSQWAAQDVFSSMDCSDIIIGAAKGGLSRIRDYYARGRHTPQLDTKWGGKDDITAAVGWESNGVTTLIFRRKLRSTDTVDYSLDKGEMLVIWSRGQEPDEIVRDVNSRLEHNEPRVSRFYVQDELKYHGLADQRGYLILDFMSRSSRVPGFNALIYQ